MKSYELNKKDNEHNPDLKLALLLKTYFRSLSDMDLTLICEDVVIKFNENKQLEKLKNLKNIILFKKQEDKRFLLKSFIDWKSKVNLMRLNDNNRKNFGNQLIANEESNRMMNNSRIDSSYMESRIKKIRKVY